MPDGVVGLFWSKMPLEAALEALEGDFEGGSYVLEGGVAGGLEEAEDEF